MSKPKLIVALDVPSAAQVMPIVDTLPDEVSWFKVGLELFTASGPSVLDQLHSREKKVFLDLKLHDIPNTVARAVASASRHGVAMLTIHAGGGRDMIKAAADAAASFGSAAPMIVAVTTLTSLDDDDLVELGISRSLQDHTANLGKLAVDAGIDGLVCSVHEAAAFRQSLGNDVVLVTPGIRTDNSDSSDQKRIATPEAAAKAGTDFIVVGRPILQAPDPSLAATQVMRRITSDS